MDDVLDHIISEMQLKVRSAQELKHCVNEAFKDDKMESKANFYRANQESTIQAWEQFMEKLPIMSELSEGYDKMSSYEVLMEEVRARLREHSTHQVS